MSQSPGLPGWIVHSDGRREPFNAETIFHRLFRASAHLGSPDPFRARELADAVLHFLAESDPGEAARATLSLIEKELKNESGAPFLDRTGQPLVW